MAHIKEKIKHFLHHDDKQVTTPDASPGHADEHTNVTASPTPLTTNIPEAYFPGARAVVPGETHSTAPYSSALGENQIAPKMATYQTPRPTTSVPSDSAAMMGTPPSGKDREVAPPTESTPAPTAAPSADDTGLNLSDEAREQPTGEGDDIVAPSEPDVQTNGTESGAQIEDQPGNEKQLQIEDYPMTDEVVERKGYNPDTKSPGEKNGEKIDPVSEEKIGEKSASDQSTITVPEEIEQKSAQENI